MAVVDDNRDSAAPLAMMLDLLGDEVATAHGGVEAVRRAAAYLPEIILMDVGMPRLNGLDAIKAGRSAAGNHQSSMPRQGEGLPIADSVHNSVQQHLIDD